MELLSLDEEFKNNHPSGTAYKVEGLRGSVKKNKIIGSRPDMWNMFATQLRKANRQSN